MNQGNEAAAQPFARSDDRSRALPLAFVLIVGAAFAWAMLANVDALYGPWYWKWLRRDLGLLRTMLFLAPPFVLFVFAWRLIEQDRPHRSAALPLVLLMMVSFGLQMMALFCHPQGFPRLAAIVVSPRATSYFTDAQQISDLVAWLGNFHAANLGLHSATHPPGPILYYYAWLKLLGPSAGAVAGGLGVGILATFGVATMYAFAGLWTRERRTRLLACAMYALLPALMIFFPEFDQVYPIFAMLIMLAWVNALREPSTKYTLLLAGALFAATFFAYNLLVVGTFVALYGVYFLRQQAWTAQAWRTLLRVAVLALGGVVVLYAALWLATGYDPLQSLAHAIREQNDLAARLMRPYSTGLIYAPYDFFLGAGMITAPLLVLFVQRVFAEFEWNRSDLVLSSIALVTILVVNLSGTLGAETARIWLFLQPLAIVPAASEMLRFNARGRLAIFAMQWFIAATLFCKISFLDP